MNSKKISRLIRFERRISMTLAAEYFSSLIGEEVTEGAFFRVASGRIPIFVKPRNEKGIAAFAGFFEEGFKEFLSKSGWCSEQGDEESVRIDIPSGRWPTGFSFLEDEIPYPMMWGWGAGDAPPTGASATSDGEYVYWMLWDSAKKEIFSIEPFDMDLVELCVEPKSVHNLAMQTLDDDCWPDPNSQFASSMEVSPPNGLENMVFDTPPTQVFSAPVTAYQADDGFDNLFGPPGTERNDVAKPEIKASYNWPLITGALLESLTSGGKSNKSGIIAELVDKRVWGLGKRTLESALARAEEAYANKKND